MDSGFYDLINDLLANGLTTDDIAGQFTNTLNAINEDRRAKEAAKKAAEEAKAKEAEMIADARDLIATMQDFLHKWNIGLPLNKESDHDFTDEEILELINDLRSMGDIMDLLDDLFKDDKNIKPDKCVAHTPVKVSAPQKSKIKINLPDPSEFAKIFRAFLDS